MCMREQKFTSAGTNNICEENIKYKLKHRSTQNVCNQSFQGLSHSSFQNFYTYLNFPVVQKLLPWLQLETTISPLLLLSKAFKVHLRPSVSILKFMLSNFPHKTSVNLIIKKPTLSPSRSSPVRPSWTLYLASCSPIWKWLVGRSAPPLPCVAVPLAYLSSP